MQSIGIIIELPMPVPLLARAVRAGFPSPADDLIEEEIDLQRLLITNRPATFLVRVAGDSMVGARLFDGDLAVVDRSLDPRDGERSFKVWGRRGPRITLALANPSYPEFRLGADALVEVWGIGPASAAKLRAMGCATVADVRDLDPRPARRGLTVVGERIIHELRGLACLDLEMVAATRKGCAVTRMFSSRVTERATMEQAVAAHAARLGEKLRREGLGTDHVTVFYHTSEHDQAGRPRSVCTTVPLPEASSDTLLLARAATWAVRRTWRDGHRYSKAGIVTMDLVRLARSQRALPGVGQRDRERSGALMAALDACNRRYGRGMVMTASAGMPVRRTWSTKFEMRSPRYTTRLSDVPVIGATPEPVRARPAGRDGRCGLIAPTSRGTSRAALGRPGLRRGGVLGPAWHPAGVAFQSTRAMMHNSSSVPPGAGEAPCRSTSSNPSSSCPSPRPVCRVAAAPPTS